MNIRKYTWKDIVSINGRLSIEEFPISGEMDGEYYRIDDFLESISKKYNVDIDSIATYMLDNINFNPEELKIGVEECGCYINGIAEWLR